MRQLVCALAFCALYVVSPTGVANAEGRPARSSQFSLPTEKGKFASLLGKRFVAKCRMGTCFWVRLDRARLIGHSGNLHRGVPARLRIMIAPCSLLAHARSHTTCDSHARLRRIPVFGVRASDPDPVRRRCARDASSFDLLAPSGGEMVFRISLR